LDVVLKEGQCLYIPRGYVHAGETTDEPSAHLSVGLRAATWGEVLRTLVAEAELRHEELRASLPPAFSTADLEEELRSRTALLAAELLAVRWEQLQPDRFRHAQVPLPAAPGSLAAALERRAG
jgi:ribosomal protein L16 Arg81 hydroxylase